MTLLLLSLRLVVVWLLPVLLCCDVCFLDNLVLLYLYQSFYELKFHVWQNVTLRKLSFKISPTPHQQNNKVETSLKTSKIVGINPFLSVTQSKTERNFLGVNNNVSLHFQKTDIHSCTYGPKYMYQSSEKNILQPKRQSKQKPRPFGKVYFNILEALDFQQQIFGKWSLNFVTRYCVNVIQIGGSA